MNIEELKKHIEEVEGEKLKNFYKPYHKNKNKYDWAPKGVDRLDKEPKYDKEARPNIVFRIEEKEIAIASIWLNTKRQGLGTYIINWFIAYGKENKKEKVSLRSVSTPEMENLAIKLGFKRQNNDLSKKDYVLNL
jgi:hypothetical protein